MAQKIQQLQLYKLPFVFIIPMGWLMKKSFIYGPSKSNIVGVQKVHETISFELLL